MINFVFYEDQFFALTYKCKCELLIKTYAPLAGHNIFGVSGVCWACSANLLQIFHK